MSRMSTPSPPGRGDGDHIGTSTRTGPTYMGESTNRTGPAFRSSSMSMDSSDMEVPVNMGENTRTGYGRDRDGVFLSTRSGPSRTRSGDRSGMGASTRSGPMRASGMGMSTRSGPMRASGMGMSTRSGDSRMSGYPTTVPTGMRRQEGVRAFSVDGQTISNYDDDTWDRTRDDPHYGFHGPSLEKSLDTLKNTFFDPAMRLSYRIQFKHHYPRCYYISTHLILPLLLLIGMCFLFGWMLARVEMPGEIENNNQALAEVYATYNNQTQQRALIYEAMANTSVSCLKDTMQNEALVALSMTGAISDLYNCSYEQGKLRFPTTDILTILVNSNPSLTFDWIKCGEPSIPEFMASGLEYKDLTEVYFPKLGLNLNDNRDQQVFRYMLSFDLDVRSIQDRYIRLNPEVEFDDDVLFSVIYNATGAKGCRIHVAGGALFWYTIMTTIGYGNTSPQTDEGRLLVLVCGFGTIIGFLILNNTASRVWKNLVEDVFLNYHLDALVNGLPSVLFWFCLTFTWMLVIAGCMMGYRRARSDENFSLKDASWFSFVTVTTVGLGDIHFAHEDFSSGDMFYLPLIVLMGFNFLAVFADKGAEVYAAYFPEKTDFYDILEARRALARAGVPFYAQDPSAELRLHAERQSGTATGTETPPEEEKEEISEPL